MKKYRTGKWNILIEVIEMTRESDSTIWFKDSSGNEDRCLKMSGSYQVWDSFQEAKNYLLDIQKKAIEQYTGYIERCNDRITTIKQLKP